MSGLTALVIGATGATGTELVNQLIKDNQYTSVVVFSRRPLLISHATLTVHIVDFENPQSWAHLVKGDVLFSALATTLKQAGSQKEQYKIDYTYQYQTAATAAANGVANYVLVSAMGANASSWLFYQLGIAIIDFFNKLGLFKSQKPLPVDVLAHKMRSVLLNPSAQQFQVYSLDSIFDL